MTRQANRHNEYIKRQWAKLRAVFNHCEICDALRGAMGIKLEFAHIRPTTIDGRSRGRKERYVDIIRHPDDYTVLCVYCHHLYDLHPHYYPKVRSLRVIGWEDFRNA